MSIVTNNKITRGVKKTFNAMAQPYKNRVKLITLSGAVVIGTMAWKNTKSIDPCEAAELALRDANRMIISNTDDAMYQTRQRELAQNFMTAHCP